MQPKTNIYYGANGKVTVNGENLNPRFDVFNHSPTGFGWGYSGSGPAQLALAILAHEYNGELNKLPSNYMAFKDEVVSKLDKEFEITSADIRAWVDATIANLDLVRCSRDVLETIALDKCPASIYYDLSDDISIHSDDELIKWIKEWSE